MANTRKRYQRQVNNIIKQLNNTMIKDNLWRGRFFCRQEKSQIQSYLDGSGEWLLVTIQYIDKKTNKYKSVPIRYYPASKDLFTANLYMVMNDFIMKDLKVWQEIPSPSDKAFIQDWSNKTIDINKLESLF